MATRILLADDSVTIQKVVELTFSDGDYEVTATTNGAQAIEMAVKLRPDIILSDIIMPEKNGYEVCEYVKSHPELRSIPVILLTGTFEPFDPERADKAGCDAVVTKPFESQSLIQKVEELTSSAQANRESSAADSPSETVPLGTLSPFENEADQEAPADSETGGDPFAESSEDSEPVLEPQTEPPAPTGDVFDEPAGLSGAEDESAATRMIPKMTFEDLDRIKQESSAETEQPREEQPVFEQSAEASSAAPFEDQEAPEEESVPPPPFAQETGSAPFRIPDSPEPGVPPAEPTGPLAEEPSDDSATRMIPKMSFEDLQRETKQEDAEMAPDSFEQPEPEPEEPAFPSAPTRASASPESSEEEDPFGSSAGSTDIDDSSTRMIPKMSFEDLQRLQQQEAASEETSSAEPDSGEEQRPAYEPPSAVEGSQSEWESARQEESPVEATSPGGDDEATPFGREDDSSEQGWAPAGPTESPETASDSPYPDDEVERIARRVVEMLSDRVLREIAWEVIPEVAEMVVRERVRELESQDS
ncbi:MAG: response regulator [Acidobacteria bacterium]|nr:response regulator [Acidobacteriota bacterium]